MLILGRKNPEKSSSITSFDIKPDLNFLNVDKKANSKTGFCIFQWKQTCYTHAARVFFTFWLPLIGTVFS